MSGKQAKRRRRPTTPTQAEHEHDVAYFAARPGVAWRVRATVPGEWDPPAWTGEPVEDSTHIVVVYDRRNDAYHGLLITPGPGIDPYDAAVVALAANPPTCWR